MHIGIDISRLSVSARTGTEHYTCELLRALACIDHHTAYTLYSNSLPAALPPLGTNFTLRRIPFPRFWTQARLSGEMHRHPPDVLFVPAHVLPVKHPPHSVVTIHDLGYLVFPQAHTALRRLDLHFSTLWSAKQAHQLIAVSHATRQALISSYGIAPEKITVVHHGVGQRFVPIVDEHHIEHVKQRYGVTGRYILYIGTIQPRKNLVRLIDAFAQVHQEDTEDVRLVIAGKKGWLTETIEQRTIEQNIADHVCFVGYVPDADVPTLMSGAMAFVFPSLYEGFGMPVLEAMACGTPVLTSTTTSLPEVAGDAALLVHPYNTHAIANGIARLLTDESLRATLRTRGLERAARFTWEQCAEKTRTVLLNRYV